MTATEPNHYIPASQKDKDWILNIGQWMLGSYLSYKTNIGYINTKQTVNNFNSTDFNVYDLWISYAMGTFDVTQFKQYLKCDELDDKVSRLIDWRQLPFLTQKVDVLKGKMSNLGYKMTATAMNQTATEEKLNVKYLAEFNLFAQKYFPELAPADSEPQNIEELELFMQNYKIGAEISCETAWECIAYTNGIQDIITQLLFDLIVCGIMGFRDYVENGTVKIRRINPKNLVFGYTEKNNFSDCSQFGEVLYLSLNEIILQDNGENLKHEDIEFLKKKFSNSTGSFGINGTIENNTKIPVLDFSVESVNERVWLSDDKNNTIEEVDPDYKVGDESDFSKKVIRKKFKVFYTGKMIIGTDMLYNYGLETNIKRNKNSISDATPSWHLNAPSLQNMQVFSLVSRCIPFINNIHIAWYQRQYMIAKARPRGLAIEVGGIDNVLPNTSPMDIIDLLQKEGDLLWKSKNENGDYINGGQKPIQEFEGGLPRDFQVFLGVIQEDLEMINRVIGLNEFTDASNPNANTGKSVAMQSVASSNNSLQPLYVAYESVLKRVANSSIMRFQDLHPEGKQYYASAVGTGVVKFFDIMSNVSLYDMGIEFMPNPSDEDIALLNNQLSNELAIRSQGGQGGLMFEDVLAIRETMKTSYHKAAQMLTIRRKRNELAAQQIAQQNAQQNAEMQNAPIQFKAQMEQMKLEAKAQEQQIQGEIIKMKEQIIAQREIQLQQMKNESAREVAYMKSEGKSSEIAMQGEIDAHLLELGTVLNNKEENK